MAVDAEEAGHEGLAMLGQIAAEIAHELRNLLQVISASAFVARQDAGRGDAAAALVHVVKIERNARTAHAIVDDLLALARGEPLGAQPVALIEVLQATRDELPVGCAEWQDEIDPDGVSVRGHSRLLQRLFYALYDNAVQASAPRSPRVVTRAHAVGERVVIDVSDDGPGVAPEVTERLFDPLVTGRVGGTGLGLSLATRIATAHGGGIRLFDAGPGRGATFRVELPRS